MFKTSNHIHRNFLHLIQLIALSIAITASGCNEEEKPVTAGGSIYSFAIYNGVVEEIGSVFAIQKDGAVQMTITVSGQRPGAIRAVHLHEGDCDNPGGYWNMETTDNYCEVLSMGESWGKPLAGDVGNMLIDDEGRGTLTIQTDLWSIDSGNNTDILGKLVAIHYNPYDFILECDSTHIPDHTHSNPILACGLINGK
ncbi:MAG: superoxide dismutase family protein [Cyclobacteriaceae bacterium]|nr:superoxide dismutase family protein [Cyclobacteriaceae bacterium]